MGSSVYLSAVAAVLEEMKGLKFMNKKAAAFGCYGWSGESVKIISQHLSSAEFAMVDGLRAMWNPDAKAMEMCVEYGKKLSGLLK